MSDATTIAVYTHLLLKAQRKVKDAQADLKSTAKDAKKRGVHWADVQAALKEYSMTAEARRQKAERQASVLSAIGVPVQLDMFDAYVPRDNDETAQAKRKGWFAAVHDEACEPPYPAGSPEGQAWITGWHEFHDAMAEFFKGGDEPAEPFADETPATPAIN